MKKLLDKTIAEYLGITINNGDIGIEVEAEFEKGVELQERRFNTGHWVTTTDNSLRNGLEFISNGPVPHAKLRAALDQFAEKTKGFEFVDSIRCSVHYHINMQKATWEEVFRAATAYWLIENLLVEPHGKDRKGNLHCLRLKDADALLFSVLDAISIFQEEKKAKPLLIMSDHVRYSALNLSALRKYGSIEFRFCRGTTDPDEIFFWGDLLCTLVRSAQKVTVEEMVNLAGAGRSEKVTLLNKLIGQYYTTQLLDRLSGYNWEQMIEENVPYGLSILRAMNKEGKTEPVKKVRPFILSTNSDDLASDDFFLVDDKQFAPRKKETKKKDRAFVHVPFENTEPRPPKKMKLGASSGWYNHMVVGGVPLAPPAPLSPEEAQELVELEAALEDITIEPPLPDEML